MMRWEAFLRQARSDFAIYELLAREDRAMVPECHPLQHLQMATEKLAKAAYERLDLTTDLFSHLAFSLFPWHLARRDVAEALGFPNFRAYQTFLRRTAPLFRRIDELCPSVGPQGSASRAIGENVEYPWDGRDRNGAVTWTAPADHEFGLLDKLMSSGDASRMVELVRRLLDRFEATFPERA